MKKLLLSLAAAVLLCAPASAQLLQKKASATFGQKKEVPAWAQKQLQNAQSLQFAPMAMESQKLLSRASGQRSRTELSYQVDGTEMQECGLVPLFNPGTLAQYGFTGYGYGAFFYGDMVSRYAGNTIKSINFSVWPGNYTNIAVFVLDGMTGEALWSTSVDQLQCINLETGDLNMNAVPCDYVVTGEERVLYIGWVADYSPSADDPYASKYEGILPYYEDKTETGEGAYINGVKADGSFSLIASAGMLQDQDGSIFYAAAAMTIDTEGENGLKDNDVYPVSMSTVRGNINTGKGGKASVMLENLGLESVTSIDYTLSLGSKSASGTYKFDEPISFYHAGVMEVPAVLADEAGSSVASLTVTKVNGVDDETVENNDNVVEGYVYSLTENYRRMPVIEEFTSNTCGWCPYGIWGLQDAMKACSDNAVAIAIHTTFNSQLGEDPLAADSYQQVVKAYAESFPSAMINREVTEHVLYAPELAHAISDQICEANITLDGAITESMAGSSVSGKVKVDFSINAPAQMYGLAYVVTEDNVKGVRQLNYFASNYYYYASQYDDQTIMQGMGWTVDMLNYAKTGEADSQGNYWSSEPMDHVACYLSSPMGNGALLPAVEQGKSVEVEFEFDVPSRKSPAIDTDNLNLAVLLFDQSSGIVVTAAQIKLSDENTSSGPSGIDAVENAANAQVAVADGAFNVTAENATAEVYTVDGKLVSSCTVNGSASLPTFGNGVYVIRVVSNGKVITKKATF
ncbi:MAG: T9SS type A sorting domain-containing protein [Alloprevotella sp.]